MLDEKLKLVCKLYLKEFVRYSRFCPWHEKNLLLKSNDRVIKNIKQNLEHPNDYLFTYECCNCCNDFYPSNIIVNLNQENRNCYLEIKCDGTINYWVLK